MNQAFFARQNFYKGTEVHQAGNFTSVDFIYFCISGNTGNDINCFVSRFAVYSSNEDATGIININFSTGFFNNLLNGFAAGANYLANFIRVNIDSSNLRSIFGKFSTRSINASHHFAHNEFTTTFSLCQCLSEDIFVDAINLNIHLNCGNTFVGTSNLKVHIAQSIFQALDVSQDGEVFAVFNETHSYAGNRSFNGNASIHQGQGACAYGTHRRRTIGFQNFGNQTDCVREFILGRNYRKQSTFCQSAVTNFTTTRATQGFGFAYAVGREVVVVDVTFSIFCAKTIQGLCFTQRSQSQNIQDLGLTTSEKRTAMRTSQQTNFAGYRTNFIQSTTIRTNLVNRNGTTNDFLNQLLGNVSNVFSVVRIFVNENFCDFCFNASNVFFTFQLVSIHQSFFQFSSAVCFNLFCNFSRRIVYGNFHFGFANLSNNFFLEFNQFFDYAVSKPDSIQHSFFGNFFSTCFYHQDSIFSTCNSKVQKACASLFNGGVDDEFAINQANANTCDGTFKRNVRNGQCAGSTYHCRHIRSIVRVNGNCGCYDLYVIMISVREHRTDRTVNQAAGQNSLFARTTFTFNKATGNFTYGIHFFFKVNGQREKVYTFTRCFGAGNCYYNCSITITN